MKLQFRRWDSRPVEKSAVMAIVAAMLCAGCSGRNVTADNPVVSLVPPRVAVANNSRQTGDTDIQHASFEQPDGVSPLDANMSGVAATVDGTPILVSDVLEPFAMQLAAARRQLSDEQYQEVQEKFLRAALPAMIDQTVLMNAALAKLDADKRAQLEQQLDQFFTQQLQAMQEKLGCATLPELEAKMQAQGTTLSNLRRAFGRQQLAQQSRQLHCTQQATVSRTELLAEYEKRIEEFKHPAQVKWQQIWISYAKHGGKQKALAVLEEAINELRRGTDFDRVAQQYSDGVMAAEGGHWDWTQKGSLADPEVERLLFELRIGEIGEPFAGKNAYQIICVTDRRPERVTPFAEVQNDLRQQILEQKQKALDDEVIKRLKKDAVITTMFDANG